MTLKFSNRKKFNYKNTHKKSNFGTSQILL